MFENQFVQELINLQKKGIQIYLTEEGWKEFLLLIKEDALEFDMDNVG